MLANRVKLEEFPIELSSSKSFKSVDITCHTTLIGLELDPNVCEEGYADFFVRAGGVSEAEDITGRVPSQLDVEA